MARQSVRRTQTRRVLLEAAAQMFAERGIADSSVDAIALAADRTSGALYDHFGSKEGLLFALLESWVDDVAVVLGAELEGAETLRERMTALWRNISSPTIGDGRWIALEHELWGYAIRHPDALQRLSERYRVAWDGLDQLSGDSTLAGRPGPAVLGVLLGLEMMRRVDPESVTDALAIEILSRIVAGPPGSAAQHSTIHHGDLL